MLQCNIQSVTKREKQRYGDEETKTDYTALSPFTTCSSEKSLGQAGLAKTDQKGCQDLKQKRPI